VRTPKIKLFYFTFILVLLQLCEPLVLFYFYFSFIAVVRAALTPAVLLEGAVRRRLVATRRRSDRTPPRRPQRREFSLDTRLMVRLYIAVVCKWQPTVLSYGEALADRIVSRYFVWYRIVSIVFSYGCIVPSLVSITVRDKYLGLGNWNRADGFPVVKNPVPAV